MPPKTIPFSASNVPQTLPFSASALTFTPAPQKTLAEQIWGGLSSVVSSIEQPFVSLAAAPVQGLAKVLGKPDPYAQGIPAGLPGANTTASVSPLSFEAKGGDALKIGSTIGAVAASPATLGGSIAVGAGIGAAQGAGTALQKERSAGEVVKQGAIGGAIGGVTAGAIAGIGKLLGAIGDKIMTSVIKPTKADIEDGFSLQTIKDYNLGGSLSTTMKKTQTQMSDLTNQLNSKLAGSQQKLDLAQVFQQTVKELTDESKLRGFGANTKIANGLQQLQQEINIVNGGGGLSIPEAQIVKQASGTFGAWQYGKPDPESKATEIIYNTFYNKLKTAIEQNSPEGVQGINQQLSKLIPVMTAVIRRLPVADRNNLISLNEMIGLVGSAVNPIALGPTLLALISRSGTAGSALSKIAPSIGSLAVPASYVTGSLGAQVSNTSQSPAPQSTPTSTSLNPTTPSVFDNILHPQFTPEQTAATRKAVATAQMADPTGAVGAIEKTGAKVAAKVLADIHPDDLHIIQRFIDYARLGKPLSDAMYNGAEKLAEKFGISMDKGLKGVANEFENVLNGTTQVAGTVFKQARDIAGRFK